MVKKAVLIPNTGPARFLIRVGRFRIARAIPNFDPRTTQNRDFCSKNRDFGSQKSRKIAIWVRIGTLYALLDHPRRRRGKNFFRVFGPIPDFG